MNNIEQLTQSFVGSEVNKLCGRDSIKEYFGKFSKNSVWNIEDIIKVLIEACVENTSIEDVCTSKDRPSADTVHRRISQIKIEDIDELINEWLIEVSSRVRFHKNTKITVSFDLHELPFYGDREREWILGTKRNKGTSYAIKFLVATITTGTIRLPVSVVYLTKERYLNIVDYVEAIINDIELWLNIKEVLLDRGFCKNDIIKLLEERKLNYVIAAIRHGDIKRAYEVIKQSIENMASEAGIDIKNPLELGKWARKEKVDEFYVDYVSTGKNRYPTRLVAVLVRQRTNNKDPLKRWTYSLFLYVTNIKCSARRIVKKYSKRWIIETDFRCIGDFKAVSNSRIPHTRILLFGLAVVLDALWVVSSALNTIVKKGKVNKVINETIISLRQTFQLMCTGRWFKRWLRTKILAEMSFRVGVA